MEAGEIVAARDVFGRRRYDPASVEMLRARMRAGFKQAAKAPAAGGAAGKAQALAFKLFAAKKSLRDIVIETELGPAVVQDLRRQYAAMGGDLLISGPVLEDLRDVLDWRGEATEHAMMKALRARIRRAFTQGQTVAAEPSNHTNEGESSGTTDGGAASASTGFEPASTGSVRVDPHGEPDE